MPKKSVIVPNAKRPADTDLTQQRLQPWPGKLSPRIWCIVLCILGFIYVPLGSELLNEANEVYELKETYDDGSGNSTAGCEISSSNQGRLCTVTFTFEQKVNGPLYLYYELQSYFQNYRRYFNSMSILQLQGQILTAGEVSLDCAPLYKNGSQLLNPCGLIANSFFNDVFVIDQSNNGKVVLDESNIALPSDVQVLYKQPQGFEYQEVDPFLVDFDSSNCTQYKLSQAAGCKLYNDTANNKAYVYYYPNDNTTQYLYEAYPNQISPIEGVTNEHFIVWMKTSMFPTFRKLYGTINGTFYPGDSLVIGVTANFDVSAFGAQKSLLISTLGAYGGRNVFLGQVYVTVGVLFLAIGISRLVYMFFTRPIIKTD